MLSAFAYNKFKELLISRAHKFGILVVKVNPAYSSLIGLVNYVQMYGMSSGEAAALVIARRFYRLAERIPTNYASLAPVDSKKHVWSNWNKLMKVLKPVMKTRHAFFNFRDAYSVTEVILRIGSLEKVRRKCASTLRCKGETPLPQSKTTLFGLGV
jgi:hypothetical protein